MTPSRTDPLPPFPWGIPSDASFCPMPSVGSRPSVVGSGKRSDLLLNVLSEYPLERFDQLGAIVERFEQRGLPLTVSPKKTALGDRLQHFTKNIAYVGGILDAITGVLSVARSFHQDRVSGDQLYTRTMGSTLASVAQISSATGAGALAGGLVAGVIGGMTLPLIIGGTVAVGTGYAVGKVFEPFVSS